MVDKPIEPLHPIESSVINTSCTVVHAIGPQTVSSRATFFPKESNEVSSVPVHPQIQFSRVNT